MIANLSQPKVIDNMNQLVPCKRYTVKPVLSGHSKKNTKIGFEYQLSLNAGQKYCRMLQGEHSAILLTCIKLSFSITTLVLSFFKWRPKTDFTVISVRSFSTYLSKF